MLLKLNYYGEHKLIFRKWFIFSFWRRHLSLPESPQSTQVWEKAVLLLLLLFSLNMIWRNRYEKKAEWTEKKKLLIVGDWYFIPWDPWEASEMWFGIALPGRKGRSHPLLLPLVKAGPWASPFLPLPWTIEQVSRSNIK